MFTDDATLHVPARLKSGIRTLSPRTQASSRHYPLNWPGALSVNYHESMVVMEMFSFVIEPHTHVAKDKFLPTRSACYPYCRGRKIPRTSCGHHRWLSMHGSGKQLPAHHIVRHGQGQHGPRAGLPRPRRRTPVTNKTKKLKKA